MNVQPSGAPVLPRGQAEDRSAGSIAGKVYVVDDDSMVRRSLFYALSSVGLEIRSFMSGADFLDEADALDPGCVLLDLRMPDLDGMSVLRRLGSRTAKLPVVMITGHGEVSVAVQAMKEGAADFLEKPFTDSELLQVLNPLFASLPESARSAADSTEATAKVASLSPRELELLRGLAAGQSNKEAAHSMNISVRTVEVHRANLKKKLGANSFSEVVRTALLAEEPSNNSSK